MRSTNKRIWEAAGLAAIVVIGLVARSWQLTYGFGNDEISSMLIAHGDFRNFFAGALHDAPHPPLYYFSLYLWLSLFGASEAAARSFSIVCSAGFLVFAYLILRRYLDIALAMAVLLIFALDNYFVFFGQQARPYSLLAFAAAFNLLFFLRAVDAPGEKRTMGWWALSCVVLVYVQYMAVLSIGLEILYALWRLKRGGWRFALIGAAASLSVVPWMIAAMGPALAQHHTPIPSTLWMVRPAPGDFTWFYASLFGTAVQIRWLFLILAALVAGYVWHAWRTKRLPPEHLFLAGLAFGIPLAVYALSVWGPKPVFLPRQLMPSALAVIVFAGLLLAAIPRAAAAGVAAVLVAIAALSTAQGMPKANNEPWREIAAFADQDGGTTIVPGRQDREAFDWYAKRSAASLDSAGTVGFLFVCRPHSCRTAGLDRLKSRAELVKRWRWGLDKGDKTVSQIVAYRIRAVP